MQLERVVDRYHYDVLELLLKRLYYADKRAISVVR